MSRGPVLFFCRQPLFGLPSGVLLPVPWFHFLLSLPTRHRLVYDRGDVIIDVRNLFPGLFWSGRGGLLCMPCWDRKYKLRSILQFRVPRVCCRPIQYAGEQYLLELCGRLVEWSRCGYVRKLQPWLQQLWRLGVMQSVPCEHLFI